MQPIVPIITSNEIGRLRPPSNSIIFALSILIQWTRNCKWKDKKLFCKQWHVLWFLPEKGFFVWSWHVHTYKKQRKTHFLNPWTWKLFFASVEETTKWNAIEYIHHARKLEDGAWPIRRCMDHPFSNWIYWIFYQVEGWRVFFTSTLYEVWGVTSLSTQFRVNSIDFQPDWPG